MKVRWYDTAVTVAVTMLLLPHNSTHNTVLSLVESFSFGIGSSFFLPGKWRNRLDNVRALGNSCILQFYGDPGDSDRPGIFPPPNKINQTQK